MPAARPRKSQRQCQSRHGLNRRTRARNAASPLPAAAVRREDPVTLSGPPSHLPDHQVVKPSLAVETVVSAGGWGAEVGWKSGAAGVGAAVRFDRVLLRLPLGQEWVHCTTGPGWARFDAGRRARLCHGDAPRWCPHAAGASAADPVTLLRLRSRDGRCRFRRFVLRRRQCPAARRTNLLPLCRVVAGAVSRLRRISAARNGAAAGTRTPRLILLAQGAHFALARSYVVPTYRGAMRKHERVAEAQPIIPPG
jgi:hypothetical protein